MRWKRLTPAPCGFSTRAASIGESVTAMKPEMMTAPASVTANSRKSEPVSPVAKPIGA